MHKNKPRHRMILPALFVLLANSGSVSAQQLAGADQSIQSFAENCAVCHGENLEGSPLGVALLGDLRHGDSFDEIVASISNGFEEAGMPAWGELFTRADIRNLALYITETRSNVNYNDFNYDTPLEIPASVVTSELHNFRFETVVADLDAQPFSIAPLPDGKILLTEKKFGVRVIDPDGEKSAYLLDTPKAYADTYKISVDQEWGIGWLFDIKPHPNYQNNGWIYLYFADRCSDCNELSRESEQDVSMNKLVRGRIRNGRWVDQETIWEAPLEFYTAFTDVAAGGRLTFDDTGHLYLSVGAKGGSTFNGIQDLSTPYGKVHRIFDDGSIPTDNPFYGQEGIFASIYTYGHRSPQGLEFNFFDGELYGTEHGPRGGDEVNHLIPGRNYGWPLTSLGMDYDGTPVEYGRELGIAFELADIEQPVVDLTPSPAVSSFVIMDSDQFPQWQGHFLVGSLKARSLFRFVIDADGLGHRETLLEGFARIRDIEIGYNDDVYLLLEHNAGSQILRMVPVN